MKTFEERYTAWIDGKLDGPALTSFELELSRRASAGEARADKADAVRLHQLLVTHLQAPAMTNADFFSHQLRERIDAESASERRRDGARQHPGALFTWAFARLAGLGAACLFVAAALYYGMVPPHPTAPTPRIALNAPPIVSDAEANHPAPANNLAVNTLPPHRSSDGVFALASPAPTPVDLNADIQVVKVPGESTDTSATPLQYKDPNFNVLWINGLDYMPTVPGESPANPTPAPTGSVNP